MSDNAGGGGGGEWLPNTKIDDEIGRVHRSALLEIVGGFRSIWLTDASAKLYI